MFDNRAPTPARTRTGVIAEISDDLTTATLLLEDGFLEEVALSGPLASEIVLGHPVKAFYDEADQLLGWQVRGDGLRGIDYR